MGAVMSQLALDFDRPEVLDARLAELIRALKGQGWVKAARLRELGFSDRELRLLVEHDEAGDVLSFPGSPGYKLYEEATIEEIGRCVALKNQSRGMMRRFVRYWRRLHRGRRQSP
jgi:hypothetical protein